MPDSGHARHDLGNSFQEALAHWQLLLQTELKRASSLPTAMFDACDPMLEARLCEATEGMFLRLLELEPSGNGRTIEEALRLEAVPAVEIGAFLRRIGECTTAAAPDLAESEAAEFHAVLVDVLRHESSAAQVRAATLLTLAHADDRERLDALANGTAVPSADDPAAHLLLRLVRGIEADAEDA